MCAGGVAIGAYEQDVAPRPVLVTDEAWCQSLLPGKNLASARKKCTSRLAELSSKSLDNDLGVAPLPKGLFVLPESFIEALVWNDIETVGVDAGDPYVVWDGGDPQSASTATSEPSPAPASKPKKLPKPNFLATADGSTYRFGPGSKKPFDGDTLKVWVDGNRETPAYVEARQGRFELENPPEVGSVVQATYTPLKKVKFKRTIRRNGSDDFFISLPRQVYAPKLRFTVRSDSRYGCSAYVYVRDFGSWEPQDSLSLSFDGWQTKTRTQGWSDLSSGNNRVWVNTNCPWTLTITDSYWKKRG